MSLNCRSATLTSKKILELKPKPPFNFDATVHKPSWFPSSDLYWEKGKHWQSLLFKEEVFGIKMENKGEVDQPKIRLTIYSRRKLPQPLIDKVIAELSFRFDFESDLLEFINRFRQDKLLGPVIKKWQGMQVICSGSLYESLVISIVLQNATVKRSVQMLENLLNAYGSRVCFDGKTLSAYWQPEVLHKVSEEDLRKLKVGYRAKFIKKISEAFTEREIDEEKLRSLPNENLKKELLKIYGVGPASVENLMFEIFRRYDFLETIPPWDQKILSRLLYNKELVPTRKILRDVDRRWGKWKRLTLHYLWEDLFWKRKHQSVPWLEKLIRL